MKYFGTVLLFLTLSFSVRGMGDSTPNSAPDSISYYYGEVNYFSQDGSKRYGGTHSVIKRTISQASSKIVEEMVQAPRSSGLPAFQSTTTIAKVDDTNVLVATDNAGSFVGKMTFGGTDWNWNSWTYAIQLLSGPMAGGRLEGKATIDASGMRIEKTSSTSQGRTLIREHHWPISSQQFDVCKYKLLSASSPAEECEELQGVP